MDINFDNCIVYSEYVNKRIDDVNILWILKESFYDKYLWWIL